jgi:Bacterial PH domain
MAPGSDKNVLWDDEQVRPVKFRYSSALAIAAVVAFLGALPVATFRWYLLPILLVPVAVGGWAWRAGTDADASGVRLRALFASRLVPWSRITQLAPDRHGRVFADLDDGHTVRLPAVRAADLPRLVAVGGPEPDHSGATAQ